jgi:hypothetical protein
LWLNYAGGVTHLARGLDEVIEKENELLSYNSYFSKPTIPDDRHYGKGKNTCYTSDI